MPKTDYAVLDEAIRLLKEYEDTCKQDNGIRALFSGGAWRDIEKWRQNVEARRTPEQRAAELTQKMAWSNYEAVRKKAVGFIKNVQSKRFPVFAIADYEGVWDTFKAPSLELAKKFLIIKNNSTKWTPEIIRAKEIKPELQRIEFA